MNWRELKAEIYVQKCPLQMECQKNNPRADVSMYLPTCKECDYYLGVRVDSVDPEDMKIYCSYDSSTSSNLYKGGKIRWLIQN